MAVLTVQKIAADGITPTFAAADAAGDQAPVGAGRVVNVKNASAMAVTVTFSIPVTVGGSVSITQSIAAGAEFAIPIPTRNQAGHSGRTINQGTGDNATWTYSAVASVTVAVLEAA